ncbi:MAG: SDR family NAD(P)-dependent oxidoreductase [Acidimicrobiales bacterium]|jgi:NAD(P)-dependent dehydrogenase (short-subunit alcohol dehydrogenase family)|nr:SDR family NAD(P)-dependent oxidoreductase [Acidimicrobiales bacterium]
MRELRDKVAVVTGGASGIGLALAHRFGAEGMQVAIGDIEERALAEAVTGLRDAGVDAIGVVTDVRDPASVDALRDETLDVFGAVHLVCNNAGVAGVGQAWEISPTQWDWVLGVNLLGVANGLRTFVPGLIDQGEGHVVNTASSAGLASTPMIGAYNASKAAVVALSETLFHDLRDAGATDVGVSVLCPSFVDTRIAECDRNAPDALLDELQDGSERAGQVETMRDLWRSLLAGSMSPAEVAGAVVDAVREGRFYIITHDRTRELARARFDRILEGGDPVVGEG